MKLWVALVLAAPAAALQLRPAVRSPHGSLAHAALSAPPRVFMQSEGGGGGGGGEREKSKSRGRLAVIARPKPKAASERKEDVEHEPSWRVLLHNDDVHTFEYCTGAIVAVVRTITRKKAHKIMVQAHSMGTATVTTTWKQMAKSYCLKLQKYGLTSSIAPNPEGNTSG